MQIFWVAPKLADPEVLIYFSLQGVQFPGPENSNWQSLIVLQKQNIKLYLKEQRKPSISVGYFWNLTSSLTQRYPLLSLTQPSTPILPMLLFLLLSTFISIANQGSIKLAKNPNILHAQTKHIEGKHHFIQEKGARGGNYPFLHQYNRQSSGPPHETSLSAQVWETQAIYWTPLTSRTLKAISLQFFCYILLDLYRARKYSASCLVQNAWWQFPG